MKKALGSVGQHRVFSKPFLRAVQEWKLEPCRGNGQNGK